MNIVNIHRNFDCELYTFIRPNQERDYFLCWCCEYDVCDVTLSVNPHRASLKNMPGHVRWESNLCNTSPYKCPVIPMQLLLVETTDNFTVHYAKFELIEQHFTISKSTDKEA
jgi:hypothetical protein